MFWASMCPSSDLLVGVKLQSADQTPRIQSDKYQCRIDTVIFSLWWAQGCPKHVEKRNNKYIKQNCAPSFICEITCFVPKVRVLNFLCTNWQRSTSLMYIGTLVVTLIACPYLFQLDWLSQSCATAVCVWSCFLTSLRLRCRKISTSGTLSNFVWNSTNLPQRHLFL